MPKTQPRLEYRNNWESDEYSVGNLRVRSLKSVSILGKTYNVSNHFFITETVFGIEMQFDLNTIISKGVIVRMVKGEHDARPR